MNDPHHRISAASGITIFTHRKWSAGWTLLMLLLTLCAARAEGPDEEYLTVYGIIDQADALNADGKTTLAHAKYAEAQVALAQFQRANPTWNSRIVSFRLNYLAEKVGATSARAIAAENSSVKAGTALAPKAAVKLLSAGNEPRTVLHLHPAVGDQQTIRMSLEMAVTTAMAGNEMPGMKLPAMLLTLDVAVKDVSADGVITYQMVYNDATVADDTNTMPAIAAALKSSFAGMRGMTGTGRMSDHGIVKGVEMNLPATVAPQLSQTMDQMKEAFASATTPLPEEAVGPDATWEFKTKIKSQGMTIDQTCHYELVSIEGNRLTLRSTVTQNASNQKIQSPAMPGLKVDLNHMTGTGTGSSTFDLAHIMPAAATLAQKTDINMGMNVGQQKQVMDVKTDLKLSIQSQ